jgi:hypothetical protein
VQAIFNSANGRNRFSIFAKRENPFAHHRVFLLSSH